MSNKKTKSEIQQSIAEQLADLNKGNNLVIAATGVGKSRIGILRVEHILENNSEANILIVVPTEQLRDVDWKEQFKIWGKIESYDKIKTICYKSIHKIKDEQYDLVIFDEVQNLTLNNSAFLYDNEIKESLSLTATYPHDLKKQEILSTFNKVIEITLKESVQQDLVSNFKIIPVYITLDQYVKQIKAGSKKTSFLTTECANSQYLNSTINELVEKPFKTGSDYARLKMLRLKRYQFLGSLNSKILEASKILRQLEKEKKRTIVFSPNINVANRISPFTYHSESDNNDFLNMFIEEKINTLSVVDRINEGVNIPNVDAEIIFQTNRSELTLTQRIGRSIRYRPDHQAIIYVLIAKNTVEEEWFESSTKNMKDFIIS